MSQHHHPCFIDSMRPITPAEVDGWGFYLNLHRDGLEAGAGYVPGGVFSERIAWGGAARLRRGHGTDQQRG